MSRRKPRRRGAQFARSGAPRAPRTAATPSTGRSAGSCSTRRSAPSWSASPSSASGYLAPALADPVSRHHALLVHIVNLLGISEILFHYFCTFLEFAALFVCRVLVTPPFPPLLDELFTCHLQNEFRVKRHSLHVGCGDSNLPICGLVAATIFPSCLIWGTQCRWSCLLCGWPPLVG